MILDFYTQVGPGVANHCKRLVRPLDDTSTPEGLIAAMDRAGVDRAVAFAPRWVGGGLVDPTYAHGNQAVHEAVQQFPNRLIGFARVNPNYGEEAVAELEKCFKEYGFKGLMLDPDWENFHPGDRELVYPLVETVRAHEAPVMFHSWYSPSEPALFWPVANDFPDVPVVIAHMGGRLNLDSTLVAARAPNVYLETSDHMHRVGQLAHQIGVERVLFGSNTPFSRAEVEMYKVTARDDLSEPERELILGGNAARLLHMG